MVVMMELYQNMRASINAPEILDITALLIDDNGRVTKCERWERETETITIDTGENSSSVA